MSFLDHTLHARVVVLTQYYSVLGYGSGGSLPFDATVYAKQPYMNHYFCQWRADHSGRGLIIPHMKVIPMCFFN